MHGLASPCSPSMATALWRSLPPSLREAAGRPMTAMRRPSNAAIVSPVQASATETPRQRTRIQREGTGSAVMVRGVNGQDGQNLARAQANTAIDQPDETVTTGRLTQRHAPKHAGRIDADNR